MAAYPSVPLVPGTDGLISTIGGDSLAETLYRTRARSVAKDFMPVSLARVSPYWLVVNPEVASAETLADLVALVHAHPGRYRFASGAEGWIAHLAGEMLRQRGRLEIVHAPFLGAANALAALIGGGVHMMFARPADITHHVAAGRLTALAVTSGCRSPAHPEIRTMMELGFPGFQVSSWYGFVVPAGTSRELVIAINREIVRQLKAADGLEAAAASRSTAAPTTPDEFTNHIRSEVMRWRRVIGGIPASPHVTEGPTDQSILRCGRPGSQAGAAV